MNIVGPSILATSGALMSPRHVPISHTISSNTANVNLWTAIGGLDSNVPYFVTCTISSGRYVYGTNSQQAFLIPTNFHQDTIVHLILSNGSSQIRGQGGNGGSSSANTSSNNGGSGYPALVTHRELILTNNGSILGGGGGGAGGFKDTIVPPIPIITTQGGGGGGGGQGQNGGSGGAGSTSGGPGGNGTHSGPGSGGAAGSGVGGAAGGSYGQSGNNSARVQVGFGSFTTVGGSPGNAITLNGAPITYDVTGTITGAVT